MEAARGADVFIVEATLVSSAEDDPRRGHLTYDEALDMGARAGAGTTVLVHHRPQNREAILAACAAQRGAVLGMPGLAIEVAAPSPVTNGRSGADQVSGVGSMDVGAMDVDRPAGSASRAARAR